MNLDISEDKVMLEGKRKAVIIGINKYDDPTIPDLEGAVYDAKEVRKELEECGSFKIDHFLVNENATSDAIRKAISDLLWQTYSCDLALFFFSGHGFVDSYDNHYLAPRDMLKEAPLVYGIQMQELKQLFLKSVNKTTVLMILDCCYSGVFTKGEKSLTENKTSIDPYFESINEDLAALQEKYGELDDKKEGEGKIILASSGETEKSREKIYTHYNDSHPHGSFSFHLIEGLRGKAADDSGIITLPGLIKHIENQLKNDKKQKPTFYTAGSSRIDHIKIAMASSRYEDYVTGTLAEAENLYSRKDPALLINAADELNKVLELKSNDPKALELKNKINETLDGYKNSVFIWFDENEYEVRRHIPNVFQELEKLFGYLHFEKIIKLDLRKKRLLGNLFKVSTGFIENDVFIDFCRRQSNPSSRRKDDLHSKRKGGLSR